MDASRELMQKVKQERFYRSFNVNRQAVDEEARTVDLAFSSEEPFERWFGYEVLDHSPGSVRTDRLNDGIAVLVNHDTDDQVGISMRASLDADRRGRAVVRFGESARATEILHDMATGIRKHVSVGYMVYKMVLEEENKDGPDTYRVSDWEPFEISIVPVPADFTVGVGRSMEKAQETGVVAETAAPKQTEETMENQEIKEAVTAPAAVEVDIKSERNKARDDERKRVRLILSLGQEHGQDELAKQFVDNGKDVSEFRAAILDRYGKEPETPASPEIGMTDKEVREFRILRMIDAMANPKDRSKQEAAAFEFEACSAARALRHKSPQGMALPADVILRGSATVQTRDLTAGPGGTGQYTVNTVMMPMIEALQDALLVRKMGATVFTGMQGDLSFPKETTQATTYWVGEADDVTESTPAFGQVNMTPKTVGAFTDLTRKFILQTSVDAENWLRGHLALKIAGAADLAAINGAGSSNEPLGILNTTGIGDIAMGTNGDQVTYAAMVGLEGEPAVDNALIGSLAFLTNSIVRRTMRVTPEHATAAVAKWLYTGMGAEMGEVLGYPCYISNNVPSTLAKAGSSNTGSHSAVIFGNWADLVMAFWSGIDINADTASLSKSGGVRVVALQDMDVAVRHPESFAAIKDAIAEA